jgi:hypothetical protein
MQLLKECNEPWDHLLGASSMSQWPDPVMMTPSTLVRDGLLGVRRKVVPEMFER